MRVVHAPDAAPEGDRPALPAWLCITTAETSAPVDRPPSAGRGWRAGGRSPGSRVVAIGRWVRPGRSAFPDRAIQWPWHERRLAAHSCGGSLGIGPQRGLTAFPLGAADHRPWPVPAALLPAVRGEPPVHAMRPRRCAGRKRCIGGPGPEPPTVHIAASRL